MMGRLRHQAEMAKQHMTGGTKPGLQLPNAPACDPDTQSVLEGLYNLKPLPAVLFATSLEGRVCDTLFAALYDIVRLQPRRLPKLPCIIII